MKFGGGFSLFPKSSSSGGGFSMGRAFHSPSSRIRGVVLVILLICTTIVLGLAIDLAKKGLPSISQSFVIFALIASAAAILILAVLLVRSTPVTDVAAFSVLDVVWLIMSILATTSSGSYCKNPSSEKNRCTELRVMMVLSWIVFVSLMICIEITLILVYRTRSFGNAMIWNEDISRLAWFGTLPPQPVMRNSIPTGAGVMAGGGMVAGGMGGVGMAAPAAYEAGSNAGTPTQEAMYLPQQQQQMQFPNMQPLVGQQPAVPPAVVTEIYDNGRQSHDHRRSESRHGHDGSRRHRSRERSSLGRHHHPSHSNHHNDTVPQVIPAGIQQPGQVYSTFPSTGLQPGMVQGGGAYYQQPVTYAQQPFVTNQV